MKIHHDIEFMKLRKRLKHPEDLGERVRLLEQLVALKPRDPKNRHLQRGFRKELESLRARKRQHRHHAQSPYERLSFKRVLALVGRTNTGKSRLLAALTGTEPEVSPNEFTTFQPEYGLALCKDVPVGVVEVPALYDGDTDPAKLRFVRSCDVLCVCCRKRKDFDFAVERLKEMKVLLGPEPGPEPRDRTLDQQVVRPGLVAAWEEIPDTGLPHVRIDDPEQVKAAAYPLLGVKRFYTMRHGLVEGKPLVFPARAEVTIADFAAKLHKKFRDRFKRARVTGPSAKFDNETVGLDHALLDGDRIELLEH
ncbi:MAG: 50S ribosome-binding GTPase [candidate division WOR-3 bacterium]|nr:MAG: 50S ribosome-binding GTPase [candidate division WOR-3 bacterium]